MKFKKLKSMVAPNYGKAHAELDASKNPMEYYKANAEPSIKGLKGVAFNKGGLVTEIMQDRFKNLKKSIKK